MNAALEKLITGEHLPHALVIDGATYEARLETARTVAAALLCSDEGGGLFGDVAQKPCHECAACKKVEQDIHPDIKYILPEKDKKNISVDIVRGVREDAYIMPNESDHKIFIFPMAEALPDYGQNALLKILEEPPAYVTFILLCESHSVLLPTIISRVATFSLDDETAIRDDKDFSEILEQAKNISSALIRRDEFLLITALAFFEKNYNLLPQALDCLQLIIRDAVILSSGGVQLIGPVKDESEKLKTVYSSSELLQILDGISDITKSINIYGNKNLALSRLAAKLSV